MAPPNNDHQQSSQPPQTQQQPTIIAATTTNFPCGAIAAKKHIRQAFRNSNDARTTITNFQCDNSLHSYFAKAFGTKGAHDVKCKDEKDGNKDDGQDGKEGGKDVGKKGSTNTHGVAVEPMDPSPVLAFLSHLGVSRHEVHFRIISALRLAIEDEIHRMPLPPSGNHDGGDDKHHDRHGHNALLHLLKSTWQFRDVPELRPILVCLLKRLGEHTPTQMLQRLAAKKGGGKDDGKDGTDDESELKNAELMSQIGISMRRLVWEADWDSKLEAYVNSIESSSKISDQSNDVEEKGKDLTLHGTTILADLIRPSVESYLNDATLVHAADLSFVGVLSERRFATKVRRIKINTAGASLDNPGETSTVVKGTLASFGTAKSSGTGSSGTADIASDANKASDHTKSNPQSSSIAITSIKDTIGSRPKLLGATLDMIISEYATTGGGVGYMRTISSARKTEEITKEDSRISSVLGGSTNLCCSLVTDILLTFGHLPKSYEVLGIMARTLDASVQSGSVSDNAIAQIQGCLRSIFRPSQSTLSPQSSPKDDHDPESSQGSGGTKIKLSLKSKTSKSSMFPDMPVDDLEYERKLLQKVLKAAIAAMRENDPQNLFLNPVTDAIAPGYSSVIKTPMCLRTMEEKLMNSKYSKIDEFKDDTLLMFSNCVKYNVGHSGQWFRNEAGRQKKLWKENIFTEVKTKLKADLAKRKKSLAQASPGSRKRKGPPPPPLAFAPVDKTVKGAAASASNLSKEADGDMAINHLTSKNINPLPAWRYKWRKKEMEIPSMQCLASMLIADPFVMRVLLDKVLKILRVEVVKSKGVPAGHPLLPSIFQFLNIAQSSVQLCALKGKRVSIPDVGLQKLSDGNDVNSLAYESIRNFVPLFAKLLLDADLDRRMAPGGDLHDAALQALVACPEVMTNEWEGASSLLDLRVVVEGSLVNLLQPGNTNDAAIKNQFPRFVAALDKLSGGNMLNERPFFMSLVHVLLKYKSKLSHSTRDLATRCMLKWLRIGQSNTSSKFAMCSALHECFMYLLNKWSALGNLVLPRDLFLSLGEEAVASADGNEVGKKCKSFVKLWASDDDAFSLVKEQYVLMLASTPEGKAVQWKEKMAIDDASLAAKKK